MIAEPQKGHSVFQMPVYRIKFLYALVLREIASGSIDPRTLAIEALKAEPDVLVRKERR